MATSSKKIQLSYPKITVSEPIFIKGDKSSMFSSKDVYEIRIGNSSLEFPTKKEADAIYNEIKNFKNEKQYLEFFQSYLLRRIPQRAYITNTHKETWEDFSAPKVGQYLTILNFYKVKRGTYFKFEHDNFGKKRMTEFVFDSTINDRVLGWIKIGDDWNYGDPLYNYENKICAFSGAEILIVKEMVAPPNKFELPNLNEAPKLSKKVEDDLYKLWDFVKNRKKKSDRILEIEQQYEDIKPFLSKLTIDNVPTKIQALVLIDAKANRRKKVVSKEQVEKTIQKIWNDYYSGKESFAMGGYTKKMYDGGDFESPRIYIANLEAYNDNTDEGEWLDFSDYKNADELMDAIQNLLDEWGVEEYIITDGEYLPTPMGMDLAYLTKVNFEEIYTLMDVAKEKGISIDDAYEEMYGENESFANGGSLKGVKLNFELETESDSAYSYTQEVDKIKLLRSKIDFDEVKGAIDYGKEKDNTNLKFYKNGKLVMSLKGDYNPDLDILDTELDILGIKKQINYHPFGNMGDVDFSNLQEQLDKIDFKKILNNANSSVKKQYKDRNDKDVNIGDAIHIRVLVGRYGQTKDYEGIVTNFDEYGNVELDGERSLIYTKDYKYNDYEHGHHIWVEKIDKKDINENLRVSKKFKPTFSGEINGKEFSITGKDEFQKWLDKNYPNSVFGEWFPMFNSGWRNSGELFFSPNKLPYTKVNVYQSVEKGQGYLKYLMIPKKKLEFGGDFQAGVYAGGGEVYNDSKYMTKEQWEKWNDYVKTGKINGKKEDNIFTVARHIGTPVAKINSYEIEQRAKGKKFANGGNFQAGVYAKGGTLVELNKKVKSYDKPIEYRGSMYATIYGANYRDTAVGTQKGEVYWTSENKELLKKINKEVFNSVGSIMPYSEREPNMFILSVELSKININYEFGGDFQAGVYAGGGSLNWQKYPTKKVRGLYEIKGDGINRKVNIVFFERYDDELYSLYPLDKDKHLFKEIMVKSTALNSLDKGVSVQGETNDGKKVSIKRLSNQDFSYAKGGSLKAHGIKQGDIFLKTISGNIQKVKDKNGKIVYVDLSTGERDAQPTLPFAMGGYTDLSKSKPEVINESKSRKYNVEVPEIDIEKIKTIDLDIENNKIRSIDDSIRVLRQIYDKGSINAYEEAKILFLDNSNKVIGIYNHSKGGITGTVIDIEMVCALALKCLAKGVIMSHNHPSGNLKFSDSDIQTTKELKNALNLFKIILLDSIIITDNAFLSMANEGILAYGGQLNRFDEGGEVTYFLNKDGIKVRSKVEPKRKLSEAEWMAKHNESKEARTYGFGGLFSKSGIMSRPKPIDLNQEQVRLKSGEYVQVLNQQGDTLMVMNLSKLGTGTAPKYVKLSEVDMTSLANGGGVGLIGNQKRIDMNKNGKIDADDFEIMRNTMDGAWRKDRKYVNSTSRKNGKLVDYEVKYARKNSPSRTGYKGKTFANGGGVGENLEVELEAIPNSDYSRNSHEGSVKIKKHKIKVKSLRDAKDKVLDFIDENDLGSGNFMGANIFSNGKKIGRVSYNGRLWNLKDEEMKMMSGGGFEKLSRSVAKNYEGKRVKPQYQKEYGKVYSKAEAKEVGDKVAGKVKANQKMATGGETKKGARGGVMVLAKKIRKEGEKWTDAVKRAGQQLK